VNSLTRIVFILFAACSSSPLELKGELAQFSNDSIDIAGELGGIVGADVMRDLDGWHVEVTSSPTFVECGGFPTALGCTSASVATRRAWVRLAKAPAWALADTSFKHELFHVWLAATTGDGDGAHANPLWDAVDR